MAMKTFNEPISDKLIKQKMVEHLGHGEDRKLLRQPLPNGYDDATTHTIYALHGSPVKAYAVRIRDRLHMYESNGKRWATYELNRYREQEPIIHDISVREDVPEDL